MTSQLIEGDETFPRRTKRKRISKLIPELRRRIPTLFDCVDCDEQLAANLGISRADLLAEVVRDLRRKGPQAESVSLARRRSNVIEMPLKRIA